MGFGQTYGAKPAALHKGWKVPLPQRFATAGLQHAGIGGCQEYVASSRGIGSLKDTLHEIGNHNGQLHAVKIVIKIRCRQTGLNKSF